MPRDLTQCACCGTTGPMYLHGKCHLTSPTWAILHQDNTLQIICATCEKPIVTFKVIQPTKSH